MGDFSPDFLRDLERVFSAGRVDLADLGSRLTDWRSATRERLARELTRLSPDDPLLCPVGLFGPLDYGRLETAQTRALAWFLDPRREHGFGSRLLTAFLQLVRPDADWSELTIDLIEAEWPIDATEAESLNRLDVYARGHRGSAPARPWVLAVEAKIDAEEGQEQLGRYDGWLRRATSVLVDGDVVKVFLTPDGRAAQTGDGHWHRVSFGALAATFRQQWMDAPLSSERGYLRYYIVGLLRDICGEAVPIRADGLSPYSGLDLLSRYNPTPASGE